MAVIKNVLREELENSLRLKESYERILRKIPRGSLFSRNRHLLPIFLNFSSIFLKFHNSIN
jgi:hypothetical protein